MTDEADPGTRVPGDVGIRHPQGGSGAPDPPGAPDTSPVADPAGGDALVQAGLVLASELSLPAVLQKIVELASRVADARFGALGVLGKTGRIEQFLTYGVTEEERRAIGDLPVGRGILGVLIKDAKPLRLRRIRDDPRSVGFPPNHPPMSSFLGVPILVHGNVYGNLYLTEKRGGEDFTEEDERAVVTLAAQAGVAIENARLYEEAQVQRRRLEAVNEVNRTILEGGDPDQALQRIVHHARSLVEADVATVAVPAEDGDELVLRVAEGAHAGTLVGMRFPAAGSISGELMQTRRPLVLADASADPRVQQPLVKLGGIGPALYVPLAVGPRSFGTLGVANLAGGRQFTEEDVGLVELFAVQAAVALDYARIRAELERLAVLEDRERIAKELHDGVVQSLFAVGMSLQAAEAMAAEPERVRARLATAVEDLDRVIRDLRNYIFGLRPGAAADRELARSLHDLADEFRRGSDLAIRVEVDSQAASVLAGRTADLVQAAREAMSNAARHSGAQTLGLRLGLDGQEVVLEVDDDGTGFDVAAAEGRGHGLANLRSRAEAVGGRLEIDSAPGRGTAVRIRVPV